jgi:hypothetical protein
LKTTFIISDPYSLKPLALPLLYVEYRGVIMMNWKDNKKKITTMSAVLAFTMIGTYNSIVINSDSNLTGKEFTFVKRLDEVYGVVTPGRQVAASVKWQKIERPALEKVSIVQVVNTVDSAVAPSEIVENKNDKMAAVQEELELNLVEVVNPQKWAQGLTPSQFSGSLTTNNGTIESLSVSLPQGESVSVSFSEMTGNVFEYDVNGELYSGMMYQVDQSSYMITLTNGPLEGTRLRFSTLSIQDQVTATQEQLAENHNVQDGNFGETVAPELNTLVQNDQAMQLEAQNLQNTEENI